MVINLESPELLSEAREILISDKLSDWFAAKKLTPTQALSVMFRLMACLMEKNTTPEHIATTMKALSSAYIEIARPVLIIEHERTH